LLEELLHDRLTNVHFKFGLNYVSNFAGWMRIPDAWIPDKHKFSLLSSYFEKSSKFHNLMEEKNSMKYIKV
jgi:hypothetical protein